MTAPLPPPLERLIAVVAKIAEREGLLEESDDDLVAAGGGGS